MTHKNGLTRRQFVGSSFIPAVAAGALSSTAATGHGEESSSAKTAESITIFSFDDVSIPYKQNLKLAIHQPKKHPNNPVLARGKEGEPDSYRAQFYGSIIRENGTFRMWYIAIDREAIKSVSNKTAYKGCMAAYAESDDGIHWVKPKLGLVEYRGSKENNLVLIDPPDVTGLTLVILHEPDDPEPDRRYKMIHQIRWEEAPAYGWTTSVPLFSADGFRWKLQTRGVPKNYAISTENMPLPPEHTEQMGLYKWNGAYYLTGQQLSPWVHLPDGTPCGRVMTSFHSHDFVNWSHAKSFAYMRDGYVPKPQAQGKESHSPASIWHRGNVLLGLHGLWEGSENVADRRMPLGLLISNDGIKFREPVIDSVFVPAGEDGEWDQRGLITGQGFEQIGDETYIWYGNWDLSAGATGSETYGGVGLLTMRRDGFGSLSPLEKDPPSQLITLPFAVPANGELTVNADGLSPDATLRIELLDEFERPLAAFAEKNAVVVTESGVQIPVRWSTGDTADLSGQTIRVRIHFEGPQREGIQFYALYFNAHE
ncbi:MAG: hypothetical protein ACKVT0_12390 [Planctomycetaceae bacterium]